MDGSPIKSLIDTHWHFDHADNNANFRKAGAGVIAHENTKKRLTGAARSARDALRSRPDRRAADADLRAGLTLNVNGEQVSLTHVAPAHTDTDVFVFFPKANVLHMGDVFFNGMYPFIDASTGGHINGMIAGVADRRWSSRPRRRRSCPATARSRSRRARGLRPDAHRVRDAVQKLKAAGKTLAEVQAAKPSAQFDAAWGKGHDAAGRLRRAGLQHAPVTPRCRPCRSCGGSCSPSCCMGMTGTAVELLLLDHVEGAIQLVPLVACSGSGWRRWCGMRSGLGRPAPLAVRVVMGLFLAARTRRRLLSLPRERRVPAGDRSVAARRAPCCGRRSGGEGPAGAGAGRDGPARAHRPGVHLP